MKTLAREDLRQMLELHEKWLRGIDGGSRAVLRGTDLRGADLTGADLTGAVLTDTDLRGADLTDTDLRGADLTGADLTGAVLRDAVLTGAVLTDAVLSDGVRWDEYLREVVPALLVAGGRALVEVATPDVWACHAWNNCPMHAAFGASGTHEVPALYRGQAERFVQLFDAGLIPLPEAAPAA